MLWFLPIKVKVGHAEVGKAC